MKGHNRERHQHDECDMEWYMSNSQRQRNMASMEHPMWSLRDGIRVCACIIIIIFTLGIKDPEGFGKYKKIIRVTITPGSPQTQRNRVAARRWISVLARKRAGIKKLSRSSPEWWLIFFARSKKKSEADSLIGPRVSTAIGWNILYVLSFYIVYWLRSVSFY